MKNTSNSITTHRTAIAQAIVSVSHQDTIEAIVGKKVQSGDVFEVSRVAGLFAVKRTSDVFPDAHQIPIDYCDVRHTFDGLDIVIEVEVQALSRTGISTEAMHGASVVALTIYDMLKPVDQAVEIKHIKLIKNKGGAEQYRDQLDRDIKTAVVVCSDSISSGSKKDLAGKAVIDSLKDHKVEVGDYTIIRDEVETIRRKVMDLYDQKYDMVILCGGTGLSPRDVTPEAIRPLLDREIPGIAEAARNFGQQHMPYAMLSRSIAGLKGNTLILTLPGSTRGAEETMDALFPFVLHIFKVALGMRHGE
jgi:molybdenum cofactor biosynthesis protein MoaC